MRINPNIGTKWTIVGATTLGIIVVGMVLYINDQTPKLPTAEKHNDTCSTNKTEPNNHNATQNTRQNTATQNTQKQRLDID